MMNLTKSQQELLAAMKSGVKVYFSEGNPGYYYRGDDRRKCTAAAFGLRQKKVAKLVRQDWRRGELILIDAVEVQS